MAGRYVLSIPVDLRFHCEPGTLKGLSLGATLLLLAPVLWDLGKTPTGRPVDPRRLLLALSNSGLAFFLCSFQVHEKSFLLPLAPLAFLALDDPLFAGTISVVAAFSMHPLLVRDGLSVPYAAVLVLFGVAFFLAFDGGLLPPARQHSLLVVRLRRAAAAASFGGMLLLHVLHLTVAPPARYPDIYPLFFAVFSSVHFVLLYMYGVLRQFQRRAEEAVEATRRKCD